MYVYHDFDYVKYILKLDFDKGFDLYNNCIIRINDEIMKDEDNKLWLAFINSGFDGAFDEFKKDLENKSKGKNLPDNDVKAIIDRITDKSKELRKKIEEEDRLNDLNKVRNEVIIQ